MHLQEAESSAPNAGTEAQQRRQQQEEAGAAQQHQFDAVVACSGHYSEPRIPLLLRSDARVLGPDDKLRGADVFPGRLMHSHNYRRPDEFAGKTVMLLGASSSGADICHEVAEHASQVRPWVVAGLSFQRCVCLQHGLLAHHHQSLP